MGAPGAESVGLGNAPVSPPLSPPFTSPSGGKYLDRRSVGMGVESATLPPTPSLEGGGEDLHSASKRAGSSAWLEQRTHNP